jgi:hypothetical protein
VALTSDAVVDLDFAQAVTLAEQPLVLMGDTASAPGLAAGVTLFTGRGRFVWGDGSGQAPSSYAALPAAALAADDTLELEVFSVKGAEPAFTSRGVVKGFRQPRSLDVTLPPDFPVELSLPPGPSPRPRLAFTPYPGARFYQLVATQLGEGQGGGLAGHRQRRLAGQPDQLSAARLRRSQRLSCRAGPGAGDDRRRGRRPSPARAASPRASTTIPTPVTARS